MEHAGAFIRKTRYFLGTVALFEHAVLWTIVSGAFFLLLGIADHLAHFQIAWYRYYWGGVAALGFALLARCCAVLVWGELSDRKIIVRIQNAFPCLGDEFLSAWELRNTAPPGISKELIDALAVRVENQLATLPFCRVIPLKVKFRRMAGAAGILFFIGMSLYFLPPFVLKIPAGRALIALSRTTWNSYFAVVPGDAICHPGSGVTISAERKRQFGGCPELFFRGDGELWHRERMQPAGADSFSYRLERVTGNIDYYVGWGDWTTPVFSLKPLSYPQAGDFNVSYRYPPYTKLPAQTAQGAPNLSAIKGTRVEISGRCDPRTRKAAVITSQGVTCPVQLSGDRIRWGMVLNKSGTYRLLLEDENGAGDPAPPVYDVTVMPDRAPDIEIVSPKEDLVVMPGVEVPLIIRAEDDFGVDSLELVFEKTGGVSERIRIDGGAKSGGGICEYVWQLQNLHCVTGDRIRYYVEARDNDVSGGGKVAATPAQSIEVAGFEKEHERIETELKGLRQELVNILADQTLTREKTKSLAVAFSTDTYTAALMQQRGIKSAMGSPADRLAGIVQRMADDPCTDFATHGEYQALSAHLNYLKDRQMNDAVDALEKKDLSRAGKEQDEIVASLEKMTLLSEDIWQYQRMRDLLDKSTELSKAGAALEQVSRPEDLRKALQDVRELLDKINKQLSGMPHELPEDFVNAPAVKKLDMRSAQDTAGALEQALADGNWERARELARALAGQLAAMNRTLEEAGKDIGFTQSRTDDLKSELDRRQTEIEALAKRQEAVLRQAETMDDKRRQAMFRLQEGLLAQLEKKQADVITRGETVRKRVAERQPVLAWSAGQSIDLMRRILEEFRQRRVFHSQKYLEDVIRQFDEVRGGIDAQKGSFGDEGYAVLTRETASVRGAEAEILSALRGTPGGKLFSDADTEKLGRLSREQAGLKEDTKRLKRSLEEFTRKSAALDPQVLDGMDQAASFMDAAGKELSACDTPRAMESGRQALDCLGKSMQGIASSSGAVGREGRMSGTPAGSPVQIRSGTGQTGTRSAPVKLPRVDEYRPPREFRQEIMDALKEKYPMQYEKMIKEYFRRLTE